MSPRSSWELVGSKWCWCCPVPQFLFPRARPAPHPHPDTCDHRQLPLAKAKDFLEEDREPARFLNRRHASPGREHRGSSSGQGPGHTRTRTGWPANLNSNLLHHWPASWLWASQVSQRSPLFICLLA